MTLCQYLSFISSPIYDVQFFFTELNQINYVFFSVVTQVEKIKRVIPGKENGIFLSAGKKTFL